MPKQPYIALSSDNSITPSPSEDDTKDIKRQELIPCVEERKNIVHYWTEPLTYTCDNYACFIATDREPTSCIAKLLIATERLDPQELRRCHPEKGQVLVTHNGSYKTYSIVVKQRRSDATNWIKVRKGLNNLRRALKRVNPETFHMANSDQLLGNWSKN